MLRIGEGLRSNLQHWGGVGQNLCQRSPACYLDLLCHNRHNDFQLLSCLMQVCRHYFLESQFPSKIQTHAQILILTVCTSLNIQYCPWNVLSDITFLMDLSWILLPHLGQPLLASKFWTIQVFQKVWHSVTMVSLIRCFKNT